VLLDTLRTHGLTCFTKTMSGRASASRRVAGLARARSEGKRLGRPPIAPALEKRIREALATPGRPGVRVIAKQFGVDPGTVQRISRPFADASVVAVV
jgi:DNA invertase Pin-like site-specific DNA recombinase